MKIVFMTGNEGKMREIRAIMADTGLPVLSMKEAGISAEIDENGTTFRENAVIKASAVGAQPDTIFVADDSGLTVDAMGGEPGVYSSRFMGEDAGYDVKIGEILRRLEGLTGEERSARFECCMAALFPDGEVRTAYATMEGQIAYHTAGENGFGYDPVFFLPEYGVTSAEITPEEKNRISHRGKALREMKNVILTYLGGV
ncbi:MAG: RdgB/HAM1 family non-canonical purine NTP pyrophosphatase [Lachnospiraceae bacterium]|nr:RdgB/HAM1 family non-canonical purine NTP pyrophosphatase [Lachnospiraceae bacterium]